jgi:hypothetical protein
MPSNRARIDVDLVEPTQYNVWLNQTAKKPRPKPWPLPKFEPLHIDDWDNYGLLNLPPGVDTYDSFKLFKLFFIDEIMDKLVAWTNEYAELYLLDEDKEYI